MKKAFALSVLLFSLSLWHKSRPPAPVLPAPNAPVAAAQQTPPAASPARRLDPADRLERRLARFHRPGTEVDVRVWREVKRGGRTFKVVSVTYTLPGGLRNRFKALVDQRSGDIVRTWGRTKHEHIRSPGPSLRPSGEL